MDYRNEKLNRCTMCNARVCCSRTLFLSAFFVLTVIFIINSYVTRRHTVFAVYFFQGKRRKLTIRTWYRPVLGNVLTVRTECVITLCLRAYNVHKRIYIYKVRNRFLTICRYSTYVCFYFFIIFATVFSDWIYCT